MKVQPRLLPPPMRMLRSWMMADDVEVPEVKITFNEGNTMLTVDPTQVTNAKHQKWTSTYQCHR